MTEFHDKVSLEPSTTVHEIELFDDEEDVAAGRRWDPLGEEKENDKNISDATIGYLIISNK